jgi:hypothetical protein
LKGNNASSMTKDMARDARRGGERVALCVSLSGALLLFVCMLAACKSATSTKQSRNGARQSKDAKMADGEGATAQSKVIATLEDASINESSGLVASRRNPDLFWTHNDSGDDPLIYAFDRRGRRRGVWRVEGAQARDWEDIAIGPGPKSGQPYLYIGDIGDNSNSRREIIVYRVPEPLIESNDAASSRKNPRSTETAEVIRMQYPDGPHNAEALMTHPLTGDIYIATKTSAAATVIYKLSSPAYTTNVNMLARVGKIVIPSPFGAMITGGDISPDGRRAVLCDYLGAYELRLATDAATSFDVIWTQPVVAISLGLRQQGEAVCYRLDGEALLATSEGRNAPIVEVELRPNE